MLTTIILSATFSYPLLLLFLLSSFPLFPFPFLFFLVINQILEICLLLSVAFSIGYAIYLWIEKYWSGAIIFTILAVISVICYFPMRRRIPLSKLLLQFVFKIAGEFHILFPLLRAAAAAAAAAARKRQFHHKVPFHETVTK